MTDEVEFVAQPPASKRIGSSRKNLGERHFFRDEEPELDTINPLWYSDCTKCGHPDHVGAMCPHVPHIPRSLQR